MSEKITVIGGGAVGCFAAITAVLEGLDVIVIDPRGPMGGAASRSAGIVTVQLDERTDVLLVLGSLRLLGEVASTSAVRTGFLQIGRMEDLSESVEAMNQADVRYELFYKDDVRYRWPNLHVDEEEVSIYTDLDLAVEPTILASEASEKLSELGVRVIRDEVVSMRTSQDVVSELTLSSGERMKVERVILAAGAHNNVLLGQLGLQLRVQVITCYAYKFDLGSPTNLPCFSDERLHSYWRPWNTMMVGGGYDAEWAVRPCYEHREPPRAYVERSLRMLRYRVRTNVTPKALSSLSGPCEITEDLEPYLGTVEGLSNLVVAGGLRGYGLMRGPKLGEMAYCIAVGKRPSLDVERYGLQRLLTSHGRG
ncbi:MAG: FAD-binding oxidoreductase [Thaumarchaeota archaeon]|nr:FAD-binding oxidoreductase [Candidatus Calditenuaceae archaeon]MDW8187579.1 FAD-binding oxidoreductase [Nitrososphaerota archaeon]